MLPRKYIDVALEMLKCFWPEKIQSMSKYRNYWILNIKNISVTSQWETVSVELSLLSTWRICSREQTKK